MIRTVRWLPFSIAVHAAALGGGVWLAREAGEPALFVDMRLIESDAQSSRMESSRPGRPGRVAAPPPARRPMASSAASATTRAPAPELAAAPPTSSVPPVAPAPPAPAEASVAAEAQPASPSASHANATSEAAAGSGGVGVAAGPSEGPTVVEGGAASGPPSGARAGASGDGPLALATLGDGGVGPYGPYLSALRRRLQEALQYPAAARRRGLSGTVHLEVALDATGRVSEVRLERSSSQALLDEAALEAARRLPRIPFPPDVRPRPLRVLMPVVFELR